MPRFIDGGFLVNSWRLPMCLVKSIMAPVIKVSFSLLSFSVPLHLSLPKNSCSTHNSNFPLFFLYLHHTPLILFIISENHAIIPFVGQFMQVSLRTLHVQQIIWGFELKDRNFQSQGYTQSIHTHTFPLYENIFNTYRKKRFLMMAPLQKVTCNMLTTSVISLQDMMFGGAD